MHKILSGALAILFGVAVVGLGLGADTPAPDAGRLDVRDAFGEGGGRIISQRDRGDGTKVLHGVQVVVGPRNQLLEYTVYNDGALEQRTQFYPNGRTFRFQRREHNGDGYEVLYGPELDHEVVKSLRVSGGVDIGPIKVQSVIAQGTVKADRRWGGTFLVREQVPVAYWLRLRFHEYRDGKLTKNEPFPVDRLGLPKGHADVEHWLWAFPEWPAGRPKSSP